LTGLVWDEHGCRLTSSHTSKGTRRYRYYVGPSPEAGSTRPPMRVPAQELEELVLAAIVAFLRDPQRLMALSGRVDAAKAQRRIAAAAILSKRLEALPPAELIEQLAVLIGRVTIGPLSIEVRVRVAAIWSGPLDPAESEVEAGLEIRVQLKRRGTAVRLVVPGADAPVVRKADPKMVALLVKAQSWFAHLSTGRCRTVQEVAQVEGVTGSHATRVMYLAFLAPDIVQSIARGEHPLGLDSTRLMKAVPLPIDWQEQRTQLGLAA
jgi:site-specific DNA recombinase